MRAMYGASKGSGVHFTNTYEARSLAASLALGNHMAHMKLRGYPKSALLK